MVDVVIDSLEIVFWAVPKVSVANGIGLPDESFNTPCICSVASCVDIVDELFLIKSAKNESA